MPEHLADDFDISVIVAFSSVSVYIEVGTTCKTECTAAELHGNHRLRLCVFICCDTKILLEQSLHVSVETCSVRRWHQ